MALNCEKLLQNAHDGIHVLDERGAVVEANPAFCRMLGYSLDEIKKVNVADWDLCWSDAELQGRIAKFMETPAVFVTRHRRKDGSVFDAEISAQGIEQEGKRFLFASARDVSDRVKAQTELRESETLLKEIFENTREAFYKRDLLEHKYLFLSPVIREITGYPVEEFIAFTTSELLEMTHPDDREAVASLIVTSAHDEPGKEFRLECRWRHKDGSYRWILNEFRVMRDADGKAVSRIGRLSDITRRKSAEMELAKSEERRRFMFDTMSEGLALNECVYDENGEMVDYRILEVNRAFYTVAGFQGGEVVGNLATRLFGMTSEIIRSYWLTRRESKEILQSEMISPISGKCYLISTSPIVDGRFVAAFTDITGRKTIELALEEKRAELRAILDVSDIAIYLVSSDYLLMDLNEVAAKLIGGVRSQLVGRPIRDFVPEYIYERRLPVMQRVFETGEPVSIEDTRLGRCLLNHIYGIADPSGRITRLAVFTQDVTAARKAEAVLRESEFRFKALFENSGTGVCIIDREGIYLMVNKKAADHFGRPADAIAGRSMFEFFPEPIARKYLEKNRELLDTGGRRSYEDTFPMAKGETTYLIVDECLLDADGKSYAVMSSSLDITERKRMESELRESEEKYRKVFNTGEDALFLIDRETGAILDVNESACRNYGYSREELLGMKNVDLSAEPEETRKATLAIKERIELRYHRKKSGIVFPVEIASTVFNLKGRGVVLASIRDISRRVELEKELRELNHELEERVERGVREIQEKDRMMILQSRQAAIGEMIGNITHQWRQPLNTIGLMIQNLGMKFEDGSLDLPKVKSYVEKGLNLIEHMSRTIDDFRDYFKPEAEMHPFSLSEIISKTLSLVDYVLKNQGIEVTLDADSDYFAVGHANEFGQVLLSVIQNAREVFTERRIKKPRLLIRTEGADGLVRVSVADNAGGIPESILPRIFEPYFTTKATGTGTGLYMSRMLVEKRLGGKLRVRNLPGGAEFSITVNEWKS